jgi:hypothetical protein
VACSIRNSVLTLMPVSLYWFYGVRTSQQSFRGVDGIPVCCHKIQLSHLERRTRHKVEEEDVGSNSGAIYIGISITRIPVAICGRSRAGNPHGRRRTLPHGGAQVPWHRGRRGIQLLRAVRCKRLGLPRVVKDWSLRSLQLKLIKIGERVVHHARRIVFQLAEVAVSRDLFAAILGRLVLLRAPPG